MDPAYGCFSDLATVSATDPVTAALPTTGAGTGPDTATGTPTANANSGGCIFEGGNQTNIVCGNNTNAPPPVVAEHSMARNVRLNHVVFLSCLAIAAAFLLVSADTSVGGCIINGTNQNGVTCNGNTNNAGDTPSGGTTSSAVVKPSSGGSIGIDVSLLHWVAILYIILNIGLVMGSDSVGGCVISGTDQQNVTCDGNTNAGTAAMAHELSPGEIAGLVLGCVAGVAALVTIGAALVNPTTEVRNTEGCNTPVWHYRRAILYKFVEGATLGFGCGCCGRLQTWALGFVGSGKTWGWAVRPRAGGPGV